MARATMYRGPLEIYLLNKIRTYSPMSIERVKIQSLDIPEFGCNWDIEEIQPRLPADMARMIDRDVIAPLKSTIELVD